MDMQFLEETKMLNYQSVGRSEEHTSELQSLSC